MDGLAVDLGEESPLVHPRRPFESHRLSPPAHGDGFRSVFVALEPDILGGVARAYDEQILALEFVGAAEVVGMEHAAREGLDARKLRNVRRREMAAGHDDIIERVGMKRMILEVLDRDVEFAGRLVEKHVAYGGRELDPRPDPGILGAPGDVVVQHLARRVGGDRLLEMVVESVIGELKSFLRAVRPQIPVHAAMHRLAVLVETRAPRVIPQAAPIALLLVANDLRDARTLHLRLLEGSHLAEAARPRADDGNTNCHDLTPLARSDAR